MFNAGIIAAARQLAAAAPADADFKMESVTYTLDGSSNVQSITIPGFGTPKAAIVLASSTSVGETRDRWASSIAFYDGTNVATTVHKASSVSTADARASGRAVYNNKIIVEPSDSFSSNAVAEWFNAVGIITDGIQIQSASGGTLNRIITVILLGGTDLEDASVGIIDGDNDVSPKTIGNRMDAGLFLNPTRPGLNDNPIWNGIAITGLGFAAWNGAAYEQANQNLRYDHGTVKQLQGSVSNTSVFKLEPDGRNLQLTGRTDTTLSFTATGSGLGLIPYLSLQFAPTMRAKVVEHDSPNVTGDYDFNHGVSGAGFKGAVQVTNVMPAFDTAYTNGESGSIGMVFICPDSEDRLFQHGSEDNANPSNHTSEHRVDMPGRVRDDTGTIVYDGGAATKGADGWSINFTTVSATTHKWPALHFVAVPTVSESFGALTEAGEGGLSVSGTSITGGDPSGHWQISGGLLSPSAAGAAADLNAGPYTLTLDDDSRVYITIAPDRRDVRTSAELQSTYPGVTGTALSGKTVGMRPGTYDLGTITSFDGTLTNYVKWTPTTDTLGDVIIEKTVTGRKVELEFVAAGDKYLHLDKLEIRNEQDSTTLGTGQVNRIGVVDIRNGDFFKITGCEIYSDLLPWRQGGTPRRQICGVHSRTANNVEVSGCDIHNVVVGVAIDTCNGSIVNGNEIHLCWGDCIDIIGGSGAGAPDTTGVEIKNNIGYDFCGTYPYLHSDCIQFFNDSVGSATESFFDVEIAGNIFFPGTETLLMGVTPTNGNATITRDTDEINGTFITANKTLASGDLHKTQPVVATGGAVTITVPEASGFSNNDTFVIQRLGGGVGGASDSNVIVSLSGSDTIDGSSADITLDDTTENTVVIARTGATTWTRRKDGPTVQGFLIQDLGDYPNARFNNLKVHGNVVYCSNTNAATIGNNTVSAVQDARIFNNSFIEIHPGDRNGDTVVDGLDGTSRGAPALRTVGTADVISFRDVCATGTETGVGTNAPKSVEFKTYTTLNEASQAALFANQDGTSGVKPATLTEAISLARPAAAGALDLGGGQWAGALGPTDGAGYWNPTTKAANGSFTLTPSISSTSPADGATGIATDSVIRITFNQPVSFGTGNIVLRRDTGGGFADYETFTIGTDDVDAPDSGDGAAGSMYIEGNVLVIVPTTLTGGDDFAVRIDETAIDGVYGDSFAGIANDTTLNFATTAPATSITSLGMQNNAASSATQDFTFTLDAAKTQFVMISGRFDAVTISSVTVVGDTPTITTRQALFKNGNYGIAVYELSGVAGGSQTIRVALSGARDKLSCGVYETAGLTFSAAMATTAQGGNSSGSGGGQLISNNTTTTAGQAVLGVVNVADGAAAGFLAPTGYGAIDASQQPNTNAAAMMSQLSVAGGSPETFNVTYGAAFKACAIGGVILA